MRFACLRLATIALLALPIPLTCRPVEASERELVDRILAVVDDDPILASEVEQVLGLGIVEREPGETDQALRRRALDFLIEQRLRFHEVDRFGFADVPVETVETEYLRIRSQFSSEEAFARRLEEYGIDEDGLRQILARQVMVLVYVDERLGARVFVGLEDIEAYYDSELVPRLVERGETVPALHSVQEEIRTLLRQQRIQEEFELWTQQLRLQADIENFFDRGHDTLPPVVHSIDN